MNKSQLIEALASRFDDNKKDAQHALESVLDTITRAVASGEKVSITGFGAFEKLDRPARMVRNPRTGERKRAKKTSVPKFRPGAELKAVVSGEKKLPRLKAATTKATAKRATGTAKKAAGTAKKTTKAATTKATPTKKAAKTTAKKATAKKAPAKKATTKKATAKKTTTKKATAKKTTTKKATAKKTTAKRTSKRTAKR